MGSKPFYLLLRIVDRAGILHMGYPSIYREELMATFSTKELASAYAASMSFHPDYSYKVVGPLRAAPHDPTPIKVEGCNGK